MYLARTSKEMHMKSDVFGLSNTKRLCRNAVLRQGDDVVLRWRTCYLITWWCGELTTSDLTQRSSLFTCVVSDLGRAHQKYPCILQGIIGLWQIPCKNKRFTKIPITISLSDGEKVMLTHTCNITIPSLTFTLVGHIVAKMKMRHYLV